MREPHDPRALVRHEAAANEDEQPVDWFPPRLHHEPQGSMAAARTGQYRRVAGHDKFHGLDDRAAPVQLRGE